MFINKKTKKQPADRSEQADSLLQNGMYQIPIFCQPFKKDPSKPFYMKDCYKYDKLPASSVLIRIKRAPISSDGLKVLSINTPGYESKKKKKDFGIWEEAPAYKYGAYNSALCEARQPEIELAEIRNQRKPLETKGEVVQKLKPIYEDILKMRAEEEELAKLNPKEREKRRKELERDRAFSAKMSASAAEEGNSQAVKADDKQPNDKDDKKKDTDDKKADADPNADKKDEKKDDGKDDKKDEDNKDEDKKDDKKPKDDKEDKKDDKKKKKDKDKKGADKSDAENDKDDNKDDKKGDKKDKKKDKKGDKKDDKDPKDDKDKVDDKGEEEKKEDKPKESEDIEDEEVYTIIDTVFSYRKDLEFLNLKFFSKYREDGGFKFIIDGIHNIPKKGFYITTYTLNPPGDYYLQDKTDSIRAYTNFNWEESTMTTTRYNEGYIKYSKVKFDTNLHFIIELSKVELPAFDEPKITAAAWTILPIFVVDPLSGQGYVNSNIYQLPLFDGPVPKNMVEELQKEDPWKYMLKMVKGNRLKYWGTASVYCRLLDIQREGHFQSAFDYERADPEYIPESKISDYRYTEDDNIALKKGKKTMLKTYIPYQEDPFNFNKRLSEVCFKKFDIKLPE